MPIGNFAHQTSARRLLRSTLISTSVRSHGSTHMRDRALAGRTVRSYPSIRHREIGCFGTLMQC